MMAANTLTENLIEILTELANDEYTHVGACAAMLDCKACRGVYCYDCPFDNANNLKDALDGLREAVK